MKNKKKPYLDQKKLSSFESALNTNISYIVNININYLEYSYIAISS